MNTGNERILPKASVYKPIYNITPFTLLDFHDKTACILWFAGCNMRCLYCYNPEIVLGRGSVSFEETLKFLRSRKNLLDGVVLSGGECTSHKEIVQFASEIKKVGMLIKVDTNGSHPEKIKELIDNGLVDYVALDFKATSGKYKGITGKPFFNRFAETYRILSGSGISFEVRTTLHSDLLNVADISEMAAFLAKNKYQGTYYLQNFFNYTETLSNIRNSKLNYFTPDEFSPVKISVRN
ncbi:MAG: anaerobic ribonucleoside-triphosphate reductase activating protein [Bacteroidia bacterium]